MKKILALLMLFVSTMAAAAFDYDGFSYNITSNTDRTVELAGIVNKSITTANIPSTVSYSGGQYRVTSIGNDVFKSCSSLASVNIPNSVTSIGNYAFYKCSSLASVTIPNSVTSIGSYAFSYCSSLTSVTIPNSVTSMGSYPFSYCNNVKELIYAEGCKSIFKTGLTSIETVTIPNSVTSIGDDAFEDCSSLASITIPNSVTSIGNSAFEDCSSLASITIPNSVTSIGRYAFSGCKSLASITIPNSVTSIGNYAFYGCSSLASVTIPNSVTSIGIYAFYCCSSLTSVTIPNSVTSIEYNSFRGCSSLTSVTIPNSVTSIGDYAFYGCSSLASVTIPNSVTSIGIYAFYCCSSLTSVTIPNSVMTIGNYAFYGCSSLASVTIPNSVTSIGDDAFKGCTKLPVENNIRYADTYLVEAVDKTLTTYSIKEGTKFIGSSAFSGCSSLASITILNSVTSIGNSAFYGCSSLASITIPNSVTSIGNSAFYGCSSLASITIPNSVMTIGNYAFYGCSSLASVTIPNSVTSIGDDAFKGCTKLPVENNLRYADTYLVEAVDKTLTTYTIKEGTLLIGNGAFEGCSSLVFVTIPNSVTYIRDRAFADCTSLTSVTIPDSVTSIGDYTFKDCSSLTSVTIPNSVTSIGYSAFNGCSSLASIAIPDGVTSIKSFTFYECSSLASITIPNSVTSLDMQAFGKCSSLASVTIPNGVIDFGLGVFNGCTSLTDVTILAITPLYFKDGIFSKYGTLHVLPGCGDAYRAADGWKNFTIVEDAVDPDFEVEDKDFWTVSSDVNADVDFHSLNEAMAYVKEGDVIQVMSGSRISEEQTITKTVKIVGPGHFSSYYADNNARFGNITIKADGAEIKGLVTKNIYVKANDVKISNCYVYNGNIDGREDNYENECCEIHSCFIDGDIIGASYMNAYEWQITNNIIRGCLKDLDSATIDHNTIVRSSSTELVTGLLDCSFKNNLVFNTSSQNKSRLFDEPALYEGSEFTYNLTSAPVEDFDETNIACETLEKCIVASGNGESYYRPTGYALKNGEDGSDIGAFGGEQPSVVGGFSDDYQEMKDKEELVAMINSSYEANEKTLQGAEQYSILLMSNLSTVGDHFFQKRIDDEQTNRRLSKLNDDLNTLQERISGTYYEAKDAYYGDLLDLVAALPDRIPFSVYAEHFGAIEATNEKYGVIYAEYDEVLATVANSFYEATQAIPYTLPEASKNYRLTTTDFVTSAPGLQLGYKAEQGFVLTASGRMRFELVGDCDFRLCDTQGHYLVLSGQSVSMTTNPSEATTFTGTYDAERDAYCFSIYWTNANLGFNAAEVNAPLVKKQSGTFWLIEESSLSDAEAERIATEEDAPEPTFVIEPNDLLALRNLYERFDGRNWRTKWNVTKERYEAEDFPGVTFAEGDDGYQHVREIALPNNGLSGNVTEWMLYFPQLTYLNLSGNALRGDVTGFVRELKALKTLDISGNQIYEIHSLPASVTTLYKGGQFSQGSGYQGMEGLTPVRVYISNEQKPVLPSIFTYDLKTNGPKAQTVYMEEKDVYTTKLTNYYASLSPLDPSTSSGQAEGYYTTAWRYSPYTYSYEQEHAMLLRTDDGSVYPAVLYYTDGDANMSGYTNVLDVQTTLNAILNPTLNVLFNHTAANTFDDALINVQDVVCTVNIVLASEDFGVSESQRRHGSEGPWRAARETSNAIYVAGDRVCMTVDEEVASLSIELEGVSTDEVGLLLNRNNFQIKGSNTATGSRYVIFSLNGTTIPAGETSILRLSTYGAQPLAATLASAEAEEIPVSLRLPSPTEVEVVEADSFDGETSIYTLDGRKTTTPTHGVCITTDGKTMGRKVLKK